VTAATLVSKCGPSAGPVGRREAMDGGYIDHANRLAMPFGWEEPGHGLSKLIIDLCCSCELSGGAILGSTRAA
jgi:hypothetical protein